MRQLVVAYRSCRKLPSGPEESFRTRFLLPFVSRRVCCEDICITIHYVTFTLAKAQVDQIINAMVTISSHSCVRFVTRLSTHRQFLNITANPTGCWASLGMSSLSNVLNLHLDGCMQTGVIVHQLMHVLGLTHPQTRPDRDFYVLVQEDAVDASQKANLEKYQRGVIEDFGLPYDYESILHCQSDAFGSTTSNRATVVPLDDVDIGQREQLSLKDIRMLNKMYDYEYCGHCLRGNCNEQGTNLG